jgi:anti-anti-sigma factor
MPDMLIETAELAPRIWCIRLHGEVDSSNLGKLKSAFEEIFSRKIYRIVLNLGSIKYLSSSAIGVIIGGFTTAVKNRGKLVLALTPQPVIEVLRLIGLESVLSFAPNEGDALKKLEKDGGTSRSARKPR